MLSDKERCTLLTPTPTPARGPRLIGRWVALALVATLAVLTPSAHAEGDSDPCNPTEGEVYPVTLEDVPTTAITDRKYTVSLDYGYFYDDGGNKVAPDSGSISATKDGQPFGSTTFSRKVMNEKTPGIFFRPDSPAKLFILTGTVTYKGVYNPNTGMSDATCTLTTTKSLSIKKSRAMPVPTTVKKGGIYLPDANLNSTFVDDPDSPTMGIRIARPSQCAATYSPSPIALRIRARGVKKWTTFSTKDQCSGWPHKVVYGSKLAIGTTYSTEYDFGNPYTAYFIPKTGNKNSTLRYQYEVRALNSSGRVGRMLRRGGITVKTKVTHDRRVYAWHGSRPNDEYWNYCVNKGKQTWMHNGNAYCIRPGSTKRAVTLTKK